MLYIWNNITYKRLKQIYNVTLVIVALTVKMLYLYSNQINEYNITEPFNEDLVTTLTRSSLKGSDSDSDLNIPNSSSYSHTNLPPKSLLLFIICTRWLTTYIYMYNNNNDDDLLNLWWYPTIIFWLYILYKSKDEIINQMMNDFNIPNEEEIKLYHNESYDTIYNEFSSIDNRFYDITQEQENSLEHYEFNNELLKDNIKDNMPLSYEFNNELLKDNIKDNMPLSYSYEFNNELLKDNIKDNMPLS